MIFLNVNRERAMAARFHELEDPVASLRVPKGVPTPVLDTLPFRE